MSELYKEFIGSKVESVSVGNEVQIGFEGGRTTKMYHRYECCEAVDLIQRPDDSGQMVGQALESVDYQIYCDEVPPNMPHEFEYSPCSFTFTIVDLVVGGKEYRFVWLGESNGYYCEVPAYSVDNEEI